METSLTVIEQREVLFYGDELVAVRADDGHVYVSVRHLCQAIGVARQPQVRRIKDHHVLAKGYTGGTITIPPGKHGGGGQQQAGMLRVDLVPLWLSGIDVKRVKPEIRGKIERYQVEVGKVLWEAFQDGRLTAETTLDDLLKNDSPAAQAYKMAAAIMQMARQQLILENRVEAKFKEYDERLESIEATLGDAGRSITPDQASQLSQAVKAVAMVLSKQSRRNEYGGVYGELYRKYGITSYKLLPTHKFDSAMQWLSDWLQSLTDLETPF